jgi:hypothetical protein
MKSAIIILLITLLVLLFSCKSEPEKPTTTTTPKQGQNYVLPPETKTNTQQPIQFDENLDPKITSEIIAVIKENLAATQAEDKERVLKTIHKDCPQMRSTKQGMDYVFANYDMVYNLEQAEVIEVIGDEAKVYYMQTTQAKSGKGFPPSRSTGIHILKKEEGKWKIFKTEYLSNEQIQ